ATTSFDPPTIAFRESEYRSLVAGKPHARFTAAHELGHFLLHGTDKNLNRATGNIVSKSGTRYLSVEWQADLFAANFLMPEHLARNFADRWELAENCQVSIGAAQRRVRDLGIWKESRSLPDLAFLDRFR